MVVVAMVFVFSFFGGASDVKADDRDFHIMTESDSGDYIGQGEFWDFSPSNNSKLEILKADDDEVSFKIESFDISWMNFEFSSESGKKLTPGLFAPAKRNAFRGSYNGINIGGDGRGCNKILGAFYVHEYSAENGVLQKAAIDFVQICDPKTQDINEDSPKLYGSIRYNSSIADPTVEVLPAYNEDEYLDDVQGVSVSPVEGGVRVAWQSVENADGYTVYFGTESVVDNEIEYEKSKVVGNVTECVVEDLLPNTTYYFAVGANDSAGIYMGSYNYSEEVSVITDKIFISTSTPAAGYEDEVVTNPTTTANPFSDVSIGNLAGKAAVELYRRGVIGGFADGEFKGDQAVNRAEAAKFLLLARDIEIGNLANSGKFYDVKEGEWYVKFVMKAAEKGIIDGYSDGNFRPANTVNTAEFLKMMTKTFEFPTDLSYTYSDVTTSDWFAQFAGAVQKYNLFPDRGNRLLEPARNLTRNEVATAIYQYLLNR